MNPVHVGLLGVLFLVILLFSRFPVAFCMALVGLLGFGYLVSPAAALNITVKDFYTVYSSYDLTVVPLFVFMGQILFYSGISRKLYDAAFKWVGHYKGGLAMATIGACAGFSAICGSTNATAATMASVALPEMKRLKYRDELATGVVASGGSLGILIPPSVIFIVYGIQTEQSIGKLFMAGILPGILLSILFILTIYIWVSLRPEIAPLVEKQGLRTRIKSLTGLVEVIILFLLVMSGLFLGIFTPTEAGAVGAFGGLVIPLVRNQLSWEGFRDALYSSTRTTCMIFMIVAGATVFGHFLAVTTIPSTLSGWVVELPLPHWAIMIVVMFFFLIGGCFMDALGMILLTIPIFFPVAVALGYDPIWFGVVIVLVTELGVITPPVGINVYVVSGIAKGVPLEVIFKGTFPFVLTLITYIVIMIFFPQIALFLPSFLAY
ncbi:TRAP transporter large permease [Desulfatiglans anilini]|uniref:TRAP transporter large permease n=1 Tax=Desulfatiglans anilini TaxID=90728 RepID=UPI00042A6A06|nr:TRAP transporter large permease [Desulfatiglans anilini]